MHTCILAASCRLWYCALFFLLGNFRLLDPNRMIRFEDRLWLVQTVHDWLITLFNRFNNLWFLRRWEHRICNSHRTFKIRICHSYFRYFRQFGLWFFLLLSLRLLHQSSLVKSFLNAYQGLFLSRWLHKDMSLRTQTILITHSVLLSEFRVIHDKIRQFSRLSLLRFITHSHEVTAWR